MRRKHLPKALCFLLSLLLVISAVPNTAFATPLPKNVEEREWALLKILNETRIEKGLSPLSMTDGLQQASKIRAKELTEKYSKTRPNGKTCYSALSEASIPYTRAGENIETGSDTPAKTLDSWMNNNSYKDNILSENYEHIGIGYSYSETVADNHFWEQFFIGSTDNSFSEAKLSTNQVTKTIGESFTLSDLGIILECTSSKYGTCYLPVLDEMCQGFTPDKTGIQTITVSYQNLTVPFTITITKPNQASPTGLKAYAPTALEASDGKITGVTATMEFREQSDIYYTTCSGNSIEALASGTYYVRYRETTTMNPSQEVTVIVPKGGTVSHYPYLSGYTDDTFRPNAYMTRGEVAVMLYNLTDGSKTGTAKFSDVSEKAWYAKAINALAGDSILSGYGDGTFRPDATITRAEFVSLAIKFSGVSSNNTELTFSDISSTAWFYSSIKTASALKWISGYSDGTFLPNNAITRGEVVVVANKMLGRSPDKASILAHQHELKNFSDLKNSHWAYNEIVEASTGHSSFVKDSLETWDSLS